MAQAELAQEAGEGVGGVGEAERGLLQGKAVVEVGADGLISSLEGMGRAVEELAAGPC